MTDLSIIMPCHNRAHELLNVLEAYDTQLGDTNFELIAVDDASTDNTYGLLSGYAPSRYSLKVYRLEKNCGPAAARNHGIEQAKSPLILIVGDDISPDRKMVWGHVVAHKQYPQQNIAILGKVVWPSNIPINTLMKHIDGIGAQQFSYHYLKNGAEYDFRHFYTANISLKLAILKQLDRLFDTDFRYAAYEDAELAYRLAQHGLKIIHSSAILGYHYHYHTIWSFSKRQFKTGLMANVFAAKHPRMHWKFRAQYIRIMKLLAKTEFFTNPLPTEKIKNIEQNACHLASYYEWQDNYALDSLYLGLLDYFYYDGVIQGLFRRSPIQQRIRSSHVCSYLLPTLQSFYALARKKNIPVPRTINIDPMKIISL